MRERATTMLRALLLVTHGATVLGEHCARPDFGYTYYNYDEECTEIAVSRSPARSPTDLM